ncbi:MAG: hypothetical protein WD040_04935 [Anaerolineales bacterium]
MNPFTRHLLETSGRPELGPFVEAWDAMESLVIRIYRTGAAGPEDETEYAALQLVLARHLGVWGAALETLWPVATIAGRPAESNPFEEILRRPAASAFVGDWGAMQTLPAARQAMNSLLQRGEDKR